MGICPIEVVALAIANTMTFCCLRRKRERPFLLWVFAPPLSCAYTLFFFQLVAYLTTSSGNCGQGVLCP